MSSELSLQEDNSTGETIVNFKKRPNICKTATVIVQGRKYIIL